MTAAAVICVAAAMLTVDQMAKFGAQRALPDGGSLTRTGAVDIVRVEHDTSRSPAILSVVAPIALAAGWSAAAIGLRANPIEAAGAGLVVGGLVSNAIDRARRGSVTNYLSLPGGHAVNGADVAIAGGVGLAALGIALRGVRR